MMKRFIKFIAIGALVSLITAGCTKNYYENTDNDRQEIVLSSRVTLAGQPRLQELEIVPGQSLSFFVTRAAAISSVLYSNVSITANNDSGFNYAELMYYPADGSDVDFYAIHPYAQSASLSNPLTFQVSANQSIQSNYLNSDLLYTGKKDVKRTADKVELVFSHKLSRLNFTIKTQDLDLAGLNGVTVLTVLPETTIDITNGSIAAASGTPTNIRAYGVAGSPVERAEVSGISAIIIPQQIPANTPLFEISIGTTTYIYRTPSSGDLLTFTEGNQYNLELTITQTGITLISRIEPWGDGGTIGGGADPV